MFFYEAQRSGKLPPNNRVSWRGDSALNDGADNGVDLSGGWYDAGDKVKFGFPMAAAATMLAWGVVEYREGYERSGQLEYILDNIKWATDYFMKAHTSPNVLWGQVGDGQLDHDWWGSAEVMQMPRPSYEIDAECPGSDLAGETAAALAAASIAFRPTDAGYADRMLGHAMELYTFADTYQGKYSDCMEGAKDFYRSYNGYWDELVWGALWLYRATDNPKYLQKAEDYYSQLNMDKEYKNTQSWDNKANGSVLLLAKLTQKPIYQRDVERWLDYWTVGYQGERITYTPGGLAWLNRWGSLRYTANTAFLALIYSDWVSDTLKKVRYRDFAVNQINYMLGQNPRNSSYVIGYGPNPPANPHHSNSHGSWTAKIGMPEENRHILYGALVGGPDQQDNFKDDRADYVRNEVTVDYNAGFTGALARLVLEYGGEPLSSFPPPEPRDNEFFVQAETVEASDNEVTVRAVINNRSAWPPRSSSALSFRYFVDLTKLVEAGHSPDDIKVELLSDNGEHISALKPWTQGMYYYVEVDFDGIPIFPGGVENASKETLFRLSLANQAAASAWKPTSDWSFQILGDGSQKNDHIPVYENEKLLAGKEPVVGTR
jgi:endoglucanase